MTTHQKVCVQLRKQADNILNKSEEVNRKIHNMWTNEEHVFVEEADRSYLESTRVNRKISMLEDEIRKLKMLLRLIEE